MSQTPLHVHVVGADKVAAALRQFGRDIEKGIATAVTATALETLTEVRRRIQGPPKTGNLYKRGKKMHQASAPGEAPATDTGALVSSTYLVQINSLTAAIGSRLDYAFYLEFGTRLMRARPSWLPASEKMAPRLEKRVEKVIAQAKAKGEKVTK